MAPSLPLPPIPRILPPMPLIVIFTLFGNSILFPPLWIILSPKISIFFPLSISCYRVEWINSYTIYTGTQNKNYDAASWKFQASNDGMTFILLDYKTGIVLLLFLLFFLQMSNLMSWVLIAPSISPPTPLLIAIIVLRFVFHFPSIFIVFSSFYIWIIWTQCHRPNWWDLPQ